MSRFALCTALVTALGMVSTAAYADVRVVGRTQITYDHDRDHYDRYEGSRFANDFHGRWVTIARGTGAEGRREFMLGAHNVYSKLRIEAVRGAPAIEKLAINFADGSTQIVPMNSVITGGGGEVIDLNGNERRVTRVIVYPAARSRGAYSVYGG